MIYKYILQVSFGTKSLLVKRQMNKSFIFIIMFNGLLVSCEDFVKVDPPKMQLIRETVFNDDKTATAAISAIYSAMIRSNNFSSGNTGSLTFLGGILSDEAELFFPSQDHQEFYNNNINPANPLAAQIWSDCYQFIYSANAIIEGLAATNQVTPTLKAQLEGESRFIRSFCYFYLTNLYGDVPYITSTDFRVNSVVARTPASQVFQGIINDLLIAKDLLREDYITVEKVRPNKWAAIALLARTYLYVGDWINAEAQATAVINNTQYGLSSLGDVFRKNSAETIWQLKLPLTFANTYEAQTFIIKDHPVYITLKDHLIRSFESNDLRKVIWIDSIEADGITYYFPKKYNLNPIGEIRDYSMILRLSEQYLVRAEARVRQDELLEGIADIDAVRSRAGLESIQANNPVTTQVELLTAIERERKWEFFAEWGHRWFDLKRTNRADIVLPSIKPDWTATDIILPVPESEVLANPNLNPQNPGYN